MFPLNPNSLVFESLITLVLFLGPLYIFFRVNNLYKLAKHRSIKSFGYAYLFFALGFLIRYFHNYLDIVLYQGSIPFGISIFTIFFTFYFPSIGVLYLSYAFIWRKVEKERMNKSISSSSVGTIIKHGIAVSVAGLSTLFIFAFGWKVPVLFYLTAIIALAYPIFLSEKKKKGLDAFNISIGGAFIVFIVLLLAEILEELTGHGYTISWTITTVIIFIIVMKVQKMTK